MLRRQPQALLVGAVIMVVGYDLFIVWLRGNVDEQPQPAGAGEVSSP